MLLGWKRWQTCLIVVIHLMCSMDVSGAIVPIHFDINHVNKALDSKWTIYSKITQGFASCAYSCLAMARCKSLNYLTTIQRCDINEADSNEAIGDLIVSPYAIFSDRSELPGSLAGDCSVLTCTDGEHCIPNPINAPECGKAAGFRLLINFHSLQRVFGTHKAADGGWWCLTEQQPTEGDNGGVNEPYGYCKYLSLSGSQGFKLNDRCCSYTYHVACPYNP